MNRGRRAGSGRTAPAVAVAVAAGLLLALLAAAIAAPRARAGTYTAAQCSPALGAGHQDASYVATGGRLRPGADCKPRGDGLSVVPAAAHTPAGAWGAWLLQPPAGTRLTGVHAIVSGHRDDGFVPELRVGGGELLGQAWGDPHAATWSGSDGSELAARLRCRRASGCAEGRAAFVALRRIRLALSDEAEPTVSLGGSLFAPGSRRGGELAIPALADAGGGVRALTVEVNGEPVASRTLSCALSGYVAIRLRPCPAAASPSVAVDTAAAPFVQGRNRVRVCAFDYASGGGANRACAARAVRVDNACPVSSAGGGAQLAAAINGSESATVGSRDPASVTGRLLTASGSPVAGARVCVAARVELNDEIERVVAAPLTAADGSFAAELPAGPSREVRVAYWPGEEHAVERFLELESRAEPALRLRPRHRLRNGDRLRFIARIPAPASASREVRLEVRSDGRWQLLRAGRTGADGTWTASYRFHATTGRRRYAFRACVPAQDGYPYARGCSPVRRKTVIGD